MHAFLPEGKEINTLIIDMNETYPADMADMIRDASPDAGVSRVSMRDVSGKDMYCSDDAYAEIEERLSASGSLSGIHFIDTGNYHYLSRIFTSHMERPYDLLLIDNHTDMQETAFGGILSCGSWAGEVLKNDPNLRTLYMYGPEKPEGGKVSDLEINGKTVRGMIFGEETEDPGVPLYISVDKDVLDRETCITNWDQGELTMRDLEELLRKTVKNRKVCGADICGGLSAADPGWSDSVRMQNTRTDIEIYLLLKELMTQG